MSRIGKKPIPVPAGVKIEHSGTTFKATGPKGTLQMNIHPDITVSVENNQVVVSNDDANNRQKKALHGTTRALIQNMMVGVSKGYQRDMQIFGTGYNVKEQGGKLVLTVGYCNTVEVPIPKSVKVEIKVAATKGNETPAVFTVSSADKHALGQFTSNVRRVRPPEPYQGKGIRYADEHVVRKEGKALASGG